MIAAILKGDTQQYHELIRPYERRIYFVALSLMKNEQDAEDTAQEVFLKGFQNLARFRGDAKFSTWLISIALNEARNRLRRQSAVRMESIDDTGEDGNPVSPHLLRDWREVPAEALERQEVRALLQQAVESLPILYREVFLLRDIEELSVDETARALQLTIPTVKVRLHRARLMLQKQLAPQLKSVNPKRRWLW